MLNLSISQKKPSATHGGNCLFGTAGIEQLQTDQGPRGCCFGCEAGKSTQAASKRDHGAVGESAEGGFFPHKTPRDADADGSLKHQVCK